MSLDVYLSRKKWVSFDEGKTHTVENEDVFSANITHNLNKMAIEAGLYGCLWRPEESFVSEDGNVYARDLIEQMSKGLELMKRNPAIFKAFNPPNGWGHYEGFIQWIERYIAACIENPDAIVNVSR